MLSATATSSLFGDAPSRWSYPADLRKRATHSTARPLCRLCAVLAGHGSAVIGSGNNRMNPSPPAHMFGAATHGMGAVGQRPSTAGGMFAAVNVRAGGGGGGGGGGGLGLQGHRMAAFGTSPDAMMTM